LYPLKIQTAGGKNLGRAEYLIVERNTFHIPDEKEIIDHYQIASSQAEKIILVGIGKESALCLMLASRFQPGELILSPLSNGDTLSDFLSEVKRKSGFLFSVCVPVTVYLPGNLPENDAKSVRRLLRRTSSTHKRIEFYDSLHTHRTFLTNLCQRRKTLA